MTSSDFVCFLPAMTNISAQVPFQSQTRVSTKAQDNFPFHTAEFACAPLFAPLCPRSRSSSARRSSKEEKVYIHYRGLGSAPKQVQAEILRLAPACMVGATRAPAMVGLTQGPGPGPHFHEFIAAIERHFPSQPTVAHLFTLHA